MNINKLCVAWKDVERVYFKHFIMLLIGFQVKIYLVCSFLFLFCFLHYLKWFNFIVWLFYFLFHFFLPQRKIVWVSLTYFTIIFYIFEIIIYESDNKPRASLINLTNSDWRTLLNVIVVYQIVKFFKVSICLITS